MSNGVKPLAHWAIYKGYRLRCTSRSSERVAGVLITGQGEELAFAYDLAARRIDLPGGCVLINEFGWELEQTNLP